VKEVSAAADDATRERSRLASALTQVAETEGVPCVPWPSPSTFALTLTRPLPLTTDPHPDLDPDLTSALTLTSTLNRWRRRRTTHGWRRRSGCRRPW
jgi:hypothetical protein